MVWLPRARTQGAANLHDAGWPSDFGVERTGLEIFLEAEHALNSMIRSVSRIVYLILGKIDEARKLVPRRFSPWAGITDAQESIATRIP